MNRFSFNKLKNSFEVGGSSNWVLVFQSTGGLAPDAANFNLINGEYCPAISVRYDMISTKSEGISVGPGIAFSFPVIASSTPESISVTLYDDHLHKVKNAVKEWVKKIGLEKGKTLSINTQKSGSLVVMIHHLDKTGESKSSDGFYILPPEDLSFSGDQSFSADSVPLSFKVIGRYK